MKKVLCVFLFICFRNIVVAQTGEISLGDGEQENVSAGYDSEFVEAIERMHARGMTRYDTVEAFRPYDFLSRQEGAKFFSQFAKEVLYKVVDPKRSCAFTDLQKVDPSLKSYIIESCLLGMFHGNQGRFFPLDTFTKGQALAVLVRILDGNKEETGIYRWSSYRQRAWDLGLTIDSEVAHGSKPVTRYEVALLLWRAGKVIESEE